MKPRAGFGLLALLAWSALSHDAKAEDFAFGGSIVGAGGVISADSPIGDGPGQDAPDPLRDANLRAKGVRPAGGFSSQLYVAFSNVRFGLDSQLLVTDGLRLSSDPLPSGFGATTHQTYAYDGDVFVGRSFQLGPVRPYVDVRAGVALLQVSVRLEHPQFGFLGETAYNRVRFLFGTRAGVQVPLGRRTFIDLGGSFGFLGYSRVVGFAGLGVKLGTDD